MLNFDFQTVFNGLVAVGLFAGLLRLTVLSRTANKDKSAAELARKELEIKEKELAALRFETELAISDRILKLKDDQIDLSLFKGEQRGDSEAGEEKYTIISRKNVVEFYDEIAGDYNRGNKGSYGKTYGRLYDMACRYSPTFTDMRVCDLGGGTGYLLSKFLHLKPHWLNVDLSQRSLDVFASDYINYPNCEFRNSDLRDASFFRENEKFDIIILNFVISSMYGSPNYTLIKSAMKRDSIVILADNHFSYVNSHPRYGFDFDDKARKSIAIEPSPMHREFVIHKMKKAGFSHIDEDYVVVEDGEIYSQIHVFKKTF